MQPHYIKTKEGLVFNNTILILIIQFECMYDENDKRCES